MAESDLDIRYLANLARLELTDQEAETYGAQLSKIIHHVEQLSTIDVTGIEPTAHATPVFDVLREDKSRPGFTQEEALANAPQKTKDQFQVTKVVE